MEERVRVLTEIASRYTSLTETLNGPSGIRGDGESDGTMPRTYTDTVREFERLMRSLREERHNIWWHVHEWHIAAVTRTVWHCPRCHSDSQHSWHEHRDKHKKLVRVDARRQVKPTRHKNANKEKAKKGIVWMADRWGLSFEPRLPQEIEDVAA